MFWRCLKQVSFQWLKKNVCFHWNFHRHPIVPRTIELYASAPNQWLVSRVQLSQPCQTAQIGKLTAYPLKRPGSQSKSIAGIWWFVSAPIWHRLLLLVLGYLLRHPVWNDFSVQGVSHHPPNMPGKGAILSGVIPVPFWFYSATTLWDDPK